MANVKIETTDPQSGETIIIAQGQLGRDVIEAEDEYYFMPAAVNKELLEMREETEEVAGIGTCAFYDLKNEAGDIVRTQASWMYDVVDDGWEDIAGKYGFYKQDMNGIITLVDGEDEEAGPDTDGSMAAIVNQGGFE